MTSEDNKRVVRELFSRLSASDVSGALALIGDDVSWRLAGKSELLPIAGEYDKPRLKRLFERMLAALDDRGLEFRIVGMVAEGDDVAAEVEGTGDLRNGRKYRQQYHLALRFRDGKVVAAREYFDTHHAFAVWFAP